MEKSEIEKLKLGDEAKSEAWVPRVGDRVRLISSFPITQRCWGWVGQVLVAEKQVFKVSFSEHDGSTSWHLANQLEPAPSAPAKAEEPAPKLVEAMRRNKARERRTWDSDKYNGIVNSDLDARIAAAKQEMQLTSKERRARLGKHDAREMDLGQSWSTPSWEDVG